MTTITLTETQSAIVFNEDGTVEFHKPNLPEDADTIEDLPTINLLRVGMFFQSETMVSIVDKVLSGGEPDGSDGEEE